MKLKVQISKTSRGDQDYIQILSDDLLSVNIVLVVDKVEIEDQRDE